MKRRESLTKITNFVANADDFGTTVEGARLNMERVAARTAEVVSEMVHDQIKALLATKAMIRIRSLASC